MTCFCHSNKFFDDGFSAMATGELHISDHPELPPAIQGNGSETGQYPGAGSSGSKLILALAPQDRSHLGRIADAIERLVERETLPEPKMPVANEMQSDDQKPITQMMCDLRQMLEKGFDDLNGRIERCAVADSSSVVKEFYTVKEVADRTPYKKWTIRDACNTGRIDGAEKGDDGKWRISHEGLEQILNYGLPSKRQGIDR